MFSFVFLGGIPLEHQVPQLKIFLSLPLIEGSFYFMLMILRFVKQLLPGLLYFYQLQYSPDHIIRFYLVVLEEFFHGKGKMSRKYCLNPIHKLKRGNTK
jgi:hypothetical protein